MKQFASMKEYHFKLHTYITKYKDQVAFIFMSPAKAGKKNELIT